MADLTGCPPLSKLKNGRHIPIRGTEEAAFRCLKVILYCAFSFINIYHIPSHRSKERWKFQVLFLFWKHIIWKSGQCCIFFNSSNKIWAHKFKITQIYQSTLSQLFAFALTLLSFVSIIRNTFQSPFKSSGIFNYNTNIFLFLSDPGIPGVWSMGTSVWNNQTERELLQT